MDYSLILPTFIAGILTFLAPCTFPLVPGYLAFISGSSLTDLTDKKKAKAARRKIVLNGLLYVIGFSAVFIFFGSLVGLVGGALVQYRDIMTRIAGVFVVLFGIFMLDVIKLPFLYKERTFKTKFGKFGSPLNSFLLGVAFAFGWTPCVGPVLASVLFLASTSGTVFQGTLLLAVFSAGLAIPFLLIAIGVSRAKGIVDKISRFLPVITKVGGVFLILLGLLLFFNRLGILISWGYSIFSFLNYEAILNYL